MNIVKQLVLDYGINFICKYQAFSENDIKKLRYGLEGIYLTVTKLVVLIFLAILLDIVKEFVLVILLFNVIRYTGFGFHAGKSYQCLLFSTFSFIVIPYFLLNINISISVIYIICSICVIHYLLFAPADTKKRPLPNKRKRIIRKLATVGIGLIYCILVFSFPNSFFQPLLLSAMVIQSIVIQPLLYMLFKQPYRNYRWYLNGLNTQSI